MSTENPTSLKETLHNVRFYKADVYNLYMGLYILVYSLTVILLMSHTSECVRPCGCCGAVKVRGRLRLLHWGLFKPTSKRNQTATAHRPLPRVSARKQCPGIVVDGKGETHGPALVPCGLCIWVAPLRAHCVTFEGNSSLYHISYGHASEVLVCHGGFT